MTEQTLRVDPLLERLRADQFERWQRGERVLVENYLAQEPGLSRSEDAQLDLLYSEVLLREERGEQPGLDEYLNRFPRFAETLRRQFAVHAALGEPTQQSDDTTRDPVREPGVLPAPVTVGDYEVLGEIGRGAMGVVYQARHRVLESRVAAVKMIHGGASREEVGRFLQEAKAAAALQHEHIVPIYEFGYHRPAGGDPVPFVALEYVEGGSLAQRIAGTPLPPEEAARLLRPLAEAMDYAHRRQIIHRDLKPANVLLASGGRVPKITDFGLAKRLDADTAQTQTGAVLGTPSYMAPEQAEGRVGEVGPAADVYGLGAILYECLTGRPPFKGATVLDTLRQVTSADPAPPRALNPDVPRDLEIICLKCLRKELGKRYTGTGELAADLGRFLAGEPIQARSASWLERAVKWVRRRPAAAALWAVSLLALAGFVTAWALFTAELRTETKKAEDKAEEADRQRRIAVAQATEAKHQSDRAAAILRLTVGTIDRLALSARGAKMEELTTRNPGLVLFELARSYAHASTKLSDDPTLELKDRKQIAEQYAASAVKLLVCAEKAKFFERPDNLRDLAVDPDLKRLQDRPDYAQFKDLLPKK